jgi:hypothetical protein
LSHIIELQIQIVESLVHRRRAQTAFLKHGHAGLRIESSLLGQLHRNVVMLEIDDHLLFAPLSMLH